MQNHQTSFGKNFISLSSLVEKLETLNHFDFWCHQLGPTEFYTPLQIILREEFPKVCIIPYDSYIDYTTYNKTPSIRTLAKRTNPNHTQIDSLDQNQCRKSLLTKLIQRVKLSKEERYLIAGTSEDYHPDL